jgi:hypothetical protein
LVVFGGLLWEKEPVLKRGGGGGGGGGGGAATLGSCVQKAVKWIL